MTEQLYKIGKVSQLTGLSVERLRMWEQRHGIAPVKKINRIRFYEEDQLRKLELIKKLIDHGYSISELKNSSNEELNRLLNTEPTPAGVSIPQTEVSVVLVGDLWHFENAGESNGCNVVARLMTIEKLQRWNEYDVETECDACILIVSSLNVTRILEVQQQLDIPMVVIYRYASKADLDSAKEADLDILKFKETSWVEVVEQVRSKLRKRHYIDESCHVFSEEELAHLSRCQTNQQLEPQDLVEIVLLQRALLEHAQRHIENAKDVQLVEMIRSSEITLEKALSKIAEEYELID
ncbi:MAG: MerR family transcriptional regulator [Gammaproteobacteria bacterium]|nr:MerR family transcriptional regulator [Gammaproteobacteria bacterium]MXX94864.1 MerR family transcriptional regulator [Gammaproteobacteria bacterium]MYK44524.1 MerR family transcriptional regulator [Gammaproteobacteria bacterium]